jgi:hypothetical protein
MPEPTWARTYTAVLRQQGPRVTATLEGSTFLTSGSSTYNTFSGTLECDRLSFYIQEPYYYFYYFPDVIEQFAPTNYFYMGGSVTTTPSGSARSGMLSGILGTMEGPPRYTALASCRSNGHRFELVRR